jgi:hypothetical protein
MFGCTNPRYMMENYGYNAVRQRAAEVSRPSIEVRRGDWPRAVVKHLLGSVRERQRGNPMPKDDHVSVNSHRVIGVQIEQVDPPRMTEAVLRSRVCRRWIRRITLNMLDLMARQ